MVISFSSCIRGFFDYFDFLIRQSIKLIHQLINLPVGGVDLALHRLFRGDICGMEFLVQIEHRLGIFQRQTAIPPKSKTTEEFFKPRSARSGTEEREDINSRTFLGIIFFFPSVLRGSP